MVESNLAEQIESEDHHDDIQEDFDAMKQFDQN
jgi:hypothetical protein